MRLRQLYNMLLEAPIEDYQTIGDFGRSSSFRRSADRRLVTNPVYIERIKNMFANTNHDFRLWFVNSAEANRHSEVGPVDEGWLQENMPQTLAEIQNRGGFGPEAINVIFTNNKGAEWRPMTGWIMAHRMGHAILRTGSGRGTRYGGEHSYFSLLNNELEKKVKELLKVYGQSVPRYRVRNRGYNSYEQPPENMDAAMIRRLLGQIGTFRSARENNMRTSAEFIFECFAQYLLKGQITFNPAPENLVTGHAWGRPQMSYRPGEEGTETANEAIEWLENSMTYEFDNVLSEAIGRIYVM
jgi:hypothetical protein